MHYPGEPRQLGWEWHVAARRGAYRFLVGKPEGKRPLGRFRFRWEDSIKIDVIQT
jgi:hypothetical protein